MLPTLNLFGPQFALLPVAFNKLSCRRSCLLASSYHSLLRAAFGPPWDKPPFLPQGPPYGPGSQSPGFFWPFFFKSFPPTPFQEYGVLKVPVSLFDPTFLLMSPKTFFLRTPPFLFWIGQAPFSFFSCFHIQGPLRT